MAKKFRVWCDSGANIHSCYKQTITLDMPDEEWGTMTEQEREDYMQDIAFSRMDWGFTEIEN